MSKRLLFIVNPRSGKGQIKEHLADILDIMVKAGYQVSVHITQSGGDATKQTIERAKEFVLEVVTPYILNKTYFFNDYKSILQEAVQTDRRSLVYELVDESGPAHDKSFTIAVRIDDVIYGKGTAGSKKEACQLAAKATLEMLARKV